SCPLSSPFGLSPPALSSCAAIGDNRSVHPRESCFALSPRKRLLDLSLWSWAADHLRRLLLNRGVYLHLLLREILAHDRCALVGPRPAKHHADFFRSRTHLRRPSLEPGRPGNVPATRRLSSLSRRQFHGPVCRQ